VPTIVAVRTYLRLSRNQPASPRAALVVGTGALAAMMLLAAAELVPWLAATWSGLLLLRSAGYVASYRPTWSARRVGITEAVLGVIYVGTMAHVYGA